MQVQTKTEIRGGANHLLQWQSARVHTIALAKKTLENDAALPTLIREGHPHLGHTEIVEEGSPEQMNLRTQAPAPPFRFTI